MRQPPPRPLQGQPVPADYFGQLHDWLVGLRVKGDLRTTRVRHTQDGAVISAPFATTDGQFTGSGGRQSIIVAEITADNDDGTYNATAQYNDAGTFADRTSDEYDFTSGAEGVLYELNGRTGIEVGTFVIVEQVEDDDGGIIWYFDHTSGLSEYGVDAGGAWVEITGGAGPSYSWKQKDPDASTDTSPSVTGTNNLYEVQGRTGLHDGEIVWARPDGTNYQFICHSANEDWDPSEIKRTQASGGSLVSGSFDRTNQGNNRGTEVNFLTGIFADASGNKLYSYYRTMICDANGHIVAVNGEKDEIVGCATFTCGGSGTPPSSTSGPYAHYPFEEGTGTTVADISGNGRDGTATGGMGWDSSAAVGSYAGDFDGTDDDVEIPAMPANNFTCAAWIKRDSIVSGTTDEKDRIVIGGTGDWGFYVYGTVDGNENKLTLTDVGTDNVRSTSTIGAGSWVHVAVTHDGSTAKFYINGSLDRSVSYSKSFSNAGPWHIGTDGTNYMEGSLDDVRIYDEVKDASYISDIYNGLV